MPPPIGFFSYATSDDESSRGRLSQLRQRLVEQLQQHVGRSQKVQIFQDVASIPLGASWERQIREGLAASSFLIPILTPAFFQSEWCCREVLQFREREAELGRDDLIFSIHYIDTDHLDPDRSDDCWSAEVYALVRTRQIANFRALRFKDYDSEAVLTALDGVAVGIRNALRPAKPPVAAPPPRVISPSPVSRESASAHASQDFPATQSDPMAIRLELVKRAPNAYVSTIKDRALFRDASFILEVSARRPLWEIQKNLPAYLRVGPNTKMNEIVQAHLPGVPLVPLPTPPPQIRAIPDHVYFYLDRTSPLWPEFSVASAISMHFRADGPVGAHWPVGAYWHEFQLELWAIRESRA